MSSAAIDIQTARQTSQLQPTARRKTCHSVSSMPLAVAMPPGVQRQLRGHHPGLDREEVGDEQRPEQVADQHEGEVVDRSPSLARPRIAASGTSAMLPVSSSDPR
jgi:hypothetical protein